MKTESNQILHMTLVLVHPYKYLNTPFIPYQMECHTSSVWKERWESSCASKRPHRSGSYQERILEEEWEDSWWRQSTATYWIIMKIWHLSLTLSQTLKPFAMLRWHTVPAYIQRCLLATLNWDLYLMHLLNGVFSDNISVQHGNKESELSFFIHQI